MLATDSEEFELFNNEESSPDIDKMDKKNVELKKQIEENTRLTNEVTILNKRSIILVLVMAQRWI